jgi:hypothetical protein
MVSPTLIDEKTMMRSVPPFVSAALVPALACLIGCPSSGTGDSAATAGPTTESAASATAEGPAPRLIFEDTFDGPEFSDSWTAASDAWSVEDGEVAVANAMNAGLWLDVELPEQVRIAFDARSLTEVGDIKFEVFTDGRTHESGYVGIFGGWNNQLNIIARLDEHGEDRLVGQSGVRVQPGETYQMVIERTGDDVVWSVNGSPFLTYEDPEPLRGNGHQYFGFNNWQTPLRFDNLKIWDLGG